jgi:hypothetical protein
MERQPVHRIISTVALFFSIVPAIAAEQPVHYFSGRVCRGNKSVEVLAGDQPCRHPRHDVTVTLQSSSGQVVTVETDKNGTYRIEPIPLHGADGDFISFVSPNLVDLTIGPLTWSTTSPLGSELGATVFLPRERTEKVTVY